MSNRDYPKILKALGLDQDETQYLEEIQMIRNKYMTGFLPPLDATKLLSIMREQIDYKKQRILKAENENDIGKYVFLHERPFRLEVFLEAISIMKVNEREIGLCLEEVWTDSENPSINLAVWKSLFSKYGHLSMNATDVKTFASLPDRVKIYRGTDRPKQKGISWTRSHDIATWFAQRWGAKGKVLTRTVNKKKVVAYYSGRGEQEIIIIE